MKTQEQLVNEILRLKKVLTRENIKQELKLRVELNKRFGISCVEDHLRQLQG